MTAADYSCSLAQRAASTASTTAQCYAALYVYCYAADGEYRAMDREPAAQQVCYASR
ncbi:MAG: hypothetical protein GY782_06485 [Gammaproteobacteria bacterium]|nr:hypothetical protein [Gammaproteobacteria bacterium]